MASVCGLDCSGNEEKTEIITMPPPRYPSATSAAYLCGADDHSEDDEYIGDEPEVDRRRSGRNKFGVQVEAADLSFPKSVGETMGMPSALLFVTARADEIGTPVEVNSKVAIDFESDAFVGKMLFLQRPGTDPEHDRWPYAEHFRPTERRWEMRVQGRFKVDPGDVFFGAQMTDDVKMTWSKQQLASWVLKVAKMLASAKGVWFDYSFNLVKLDDGGVVRPHYVSPMCAAEALYVTPEGETPPDITKKIPWSPLSEKQKIKINTKDTYTIALWNKQLDFGRWMMLNMPLGWTSSFTPFLGEQPVSLIGYGLRRDSKNGGQHVDSDKSLLLRLELWPCARTSDWKNPPAMIWQPAKAKSTEEQRTSEIVPGAGEAATNGSRWFKSCCAWCR